MIFRRAIAVVSTAVVLAAAPAASAQVVAPGGRTLFNRGVMIRSFVRVDSFNEVEPGMRVRRIVNPYAVVWGAYPHLSLSFVTPVVQLDREMPGNSGSDIRTTGTADSTVFARYDAIRKIVPAGYTRLAPEFGVKLPTGGAFGTGSTDFVGSLVFSHIRDPNWLVADLQFTYNRTGDNNHRRGHRTRYDVAYLRRLLPGERLGVAGLLVVLELNGETAERSRSNGERIPNTGGDLIFLSPGVEYFVSRQVVLEASLPIRIYEDLDGSQNRPTYSAIVGFRWLM